MSDEKLKQILAEFESLVSYIIAELEGQLGLEHPEWVELSLEEIQNYVYD